ncbi:NADH-quinone oxidoreductase subunit C [Ornithinimicrobium cerasi]|uniref:NADH-quinone oxidoreductase subunit C n=1 Tax=Ornithinimicrobium cerasi TaxID=2248773 RepID=A0A285VPG6_9MICO|nr:NADH-quinone oxidoreductase subunit C [Ornithinimicrobium cerasi]SOC55950.1 NADH dehydrogenase subunit C [Ornithinimicrobium cerasi]
MTSTGPETPDKTPPSQTTTRDDEHQPARTEDQVVDTTTAQAGDAVRPSTPGEPVVVARRQGMFGGTLGTDTSGYGGLDVPVLLPGGAERPYGSYFDEVVDALQAAAPEAFESGVEQVVVDRGELTLVVRREHLRALLQVLRDDARLRFELGLGVSGVHWPEQTGAELHAVYHFASITHGMRRVRFDVSCPEDDPRVPTIVDIYPANDWHERETFDMFGIVFEGHRGLTRILMPDDWAGHPQRKDYPLGGVPVEYHGATIPAPDQRRSYK